MLPRFNRSEREKRKLMFRKLRDPHLLQVLLLPAMMTTTAAFPFLPLNKIIQNDVISLTCPFMDFSFFSTFIYVSGFSLITTQKPEFCKLSKNKTKSVKKSGMKTFYFFSRRKLISFENFSALKRERMNKFPFLLLLPFTLLFD